MRCAGCLIAPALLASCSLYFGPDRSTPDAWPGGFIPGDDRQSCGTPLPESAPPTITIHGAVALATDAIGVPPPTIELWRAGDAAPLATTVTDAHHQYALAVVTAGGPIDGYLRATAPGMVDTILYPAVPFASDATIAVPLLDRAHYDTTIGSAYDDAAADLYMTVVDCKGLPAEDARVTLRPRGDARITYPGSDFGDATGPMGIAIAHGAPTGSIFLAGTWSYGTLRAHYVETHPGAFEQVAVSP